LTEQRRAEQIRFEDEVVVIVVVVVEPGAWSTVRSTERGGR
jgi:hypothetical protein